jgi:hypothetical protein
MKILSVTLIALILFAIVFWGLFYYSVRVARETIITLEATSTANPSVTTSTTPQSPSATPTSPQGPTNLPHIIGPSGPPPSY